MQGLNDEAEQEEDSGPLFLPGAMFGPFRIVAVLGRGGMATVYEAYDTKLERAVALKVLPPYFRHGQSLARRFEQEARVIARLDHRGIVPIYASGTDDDIPWMSMRLLPGGNMGTLLKRAPPDRARAIRILGQVAEALDYAHAHGVVHRDIKPTNILFDRDGQPCVGDFGLAQMLEGSPVVTRAGVVIGTPSYMAPEQAEGKAVDHRCDVYSLGVVAYEMLTGQLPFTGDSPLAVLLKHVSEPLPVPAPKQLPERLLKAIQKAAAKDPSDRWASAGAFTRALASSLEPDNVSQSTPDLNATVETDGPRRLLIGAERQHIVIATVALIVAGATAWLSFTLWPSAPTQPATTEIAQVDVSRKPEAAPVVPPVTAPAPAPPPPPVRGTQPPRTTASTDDQVFVSAGSPQRSALSRDTTPSAPPENPAETAPTTSVTTQTGAPPPAPGVVDDRPQPPGAGVVPPQSPSGEDVIPPSRTRTVPPTYPDVARAAEIEGDVVLQATVGADGAVSDVVVVRRVHPLLDAAAVAAVRQYEYAPGRRNGVPVAVRIRTTVSFKLR